MARQTALAPGLAALAEAWRDRLADEPPAGAPEVAARAGAFEAAVSQTRSRLRKRGNSPRDLSARTRHAFQWMALLSDPHHLAVHLDALARLTPHRRLSLWSEPPKPVLYPSSHLVRQHGGRRLVANQGYMDAPTEILRALPDAIRGRGARRDVLAYASSASFTRVTQLMDDSLGATPPRAPDGRCVDMSALYDTLNARYFGGELGRAQLRWSARRSHRRLGHYESATDTIVLSRTLDDPGVPPVLVAFVMYHEMLHKKLGVVRVNGRQRAHTPAFRRAERQFEDFAEASRLLQQPLS